MIPRFAVRHPVTVAMLFLAGTLLGILSLRRLPVDLLPDLDAPKVAVLLRSGDRPPEELEDRYARQLETALATLPEVTSVRSVTSTGRVLVIVELDWDADMDRALLDVQATATRLSTDRDVDSVVVRRFDPSSEPVMVLALRARDDEGEEGLDPLRRLAEDRVARALERLPGVALAQVAGGRRREAVVRFDPDRLEELGLDAERLALLIQQSNVEASGGTVEDRGRVHVIKGLGKLRDLEELASIPVAPARAGDATSQPLHLDDVASVAWENAPVRGLVTIDGREGVSISVFKEAGENTIAVSDAVREALGGIGDDLGGRPITIVRDQADAVRRSIDDVEIAAIVGGLLSVLVLLFFLRSARALLLVALSIPVSIVLIFPVMQALGLSLNVMTLGGIALGTGIVIDNAIVVLEAIFRRLEAGEDPFEAAERGASEVGAAILAATLTLCVVFLPVVFLRGIAAEIFSDLALSVVIQLACSWAVAMLLMPSIAARLFRKGHVLSWGGGERLDASYERLVRGSLRRPLLVLGAAAASVAVAVALAPRVGAEFMPAADTGEVTAHVVLPEGSRAEITRQAAARLEDAVRSAFPGAVEVAHAEIGEAVREDLVLTEQVPAESRGILRIQLARERKVTTAQIERALESAARAVPGLGLRLEPADAVLSRLAQSGPPVRVEIRGQDLVAIERTTGDVARELARLPALFNVRSSFDERRAEMRIVLDRAVVAGLGLSPDDVARQLRRQLANESVTTFRPDGEDRDIVVRGGERSAANLRDTVLETSGGRRVRLAEIATVTVESAPVRIERSRGARLGVVTAHVAETSDLGAAAASVESSLRGMRLAPGLRAAITGAEQSRRASFGELGLAVILAIALVYMVMASLFESIVHPFTILLTLPTAGVGVVLALLLTSTPLSVPALIGIVMLAGIAVSNGILLVDVARRLREEGVPRQEAAARAGRLRLRAILMTSVTTVLGMLPLAWGGEGAQVQAPLAIAVMGGLTSSTLLTLFVIPAAFDMLERLRHPGRG